MIPVTFTSHSFSECILRTPLTRGRWRLSRDDRARTSFTRTPPRSIPVQLMMFASGRGFAPPFTDLGCAYMRSARQRTYAAALQFPAQTRTLDTTTRGCVPLVPDTLPPRLRPATTHRRNKGQSQRTEKHRTHDIAVLTATEYAQFTTFLTERRRPRFSESIEWAHTWPVTRRTRILACAGSLHSPMETFWCDSAECRGAPLEVDAFPRRLRR